MTVFYFYWNQPLFQAARGADGKVLADRKIYSEKDIQALKQASDEFITGNNKKRACAAFAAVLSDLPPASVLTVGETWLIVSVLMEGEPWLGADTSSSDYKSMSRKIFNSLVKETWLPGPNGGSLVYGLKLRDPATRKGIIPAGTVWTWLSNFVDRFLYCV